MVARSTRTSTLLFGANSAGKSTILHALHESNYLYLVNYAGKSNSVSIRAIISWTKLSGTSQMGCHLRSFQSCERT